MQYTVFFFSAAKIDIFSLRNSDISLFFAQNFNIDHEYMLEPPQQAVLTCTHNLFCAINKKNINFFNRKFSFLHPKTENLYCSLLRRVFRMLSPRQYSWPISYTFQVQC